MAESTLSPVHAKINRDVAHYLRYGRKADASEGLNATQIANVTAARLAGEARFAGSHDWGFFHPRLDFTLWASVAVNASVTVAQAASTTLTATGGTPFLASMVGKSIVLTGPAVTKTIVSFTDTTHVVVSSSATFSGSTFSIASDGIYRLPDDFGGMESTQIEFGRDSGWPNIIDVVSEELIRKAWQLNDTTGRPKRASPYIRANDGTGQRWDLIVEPIPNQDYPVSFRYNSLPDAMDATDYGAGGVLFADALLKCCLAAAEEQNYENQNLMAMQEQKSLEKAIRFDLRYNRSRRLGHTTTSNFRELEESMYSRATGFVYRGTTYDVE